MLLRSRPPSTVVNEGERPCLVGTGPGIKLQAQPLWPHRVPTKDRAGQRVRVSLASRRVAMPDGSDAASPLNCC
jgi:hypothetical protein